MNSALLEAPPEVVWRALKSFDHLDAVRPLALRTVLPEPTHCTLVGEGVGAERRCYFDSGRIVERVTAWQPPSLMELEVVEVDLPTLRTIGFIAATYHLSEDDGRTRVTRATSMWSTLRPGAWFGPLERLGIETEHEYFLGALAKRIHADGTTP